MTAPDDELGTESVELVRPYVITNGRGLPDRDRFDLITLVTASAADKRTDRLDPEKRSLVALCQGAIFRSPK